MFFDYIKKQITRKGCLVKINNGDFIYYCDEKEPSIGWRSRSYIVSKDFKGVMNFKCKLFLPEKYTFKFEHENPEFENLLDNIEFIKTTDEIELGKGDFI